MYFLHDNLQWHIQREWSCVMSSDRVYEKKHTCSKVYVFGGWREVVFWDFWRGGGGLQCIPCGPKNNVQEL